MSQYPSWLPAETEFLEKMADDLPFPDLVRRMQARARRMGWPSRSMKAIALKLARCGHRARVRHGAWVTSGGVADLIGCPPSRIVKWLQQPSILEILQPHQIGKVRYFDRAAWRRLARIYPRLLGGFSADRLFLLLEDRELADAVASQYPVEIGDFRIRCIETGQVWPSSCAAAEQLHISSSAISLAIRKGRSVTSIGLTFEALRRSA
jgi:hypothetical protein